MTDVRTQWERAPLEAIHPLWGAGEQAFYESGEGPATQVRYAWDRFGIRGGRGIPPRLLDYGAGAGRLTVHLATWAGTVTAEEPNPTYRKHARRKAAELGLTNVEVVDGEAAGHFDVAVAHNMLIHYPPPEAAAIIAGLSLRASLLVLQLPVYPVARWGTSWLDVSVWTPDMVHVLAGALKLDLLDMTPNPDPFSWQAVGPYHDAPVVLRTAVSRPRRSCCGG